MGTGYWPTQRQCHCATIVVVNLPSTQSIKALHHKYSPCDDVFDLIWQHSCIVRDIALQLIDTNSLAVDTTLVRVGSMLHDIGAYPLFGTDGVLLPGINYITHGVEGEAILKREGFPESIWRFASHHTGVGLTKQDVIDQGLPLPVDDYLARTDEELLIMYADKFHSKTTPPYLNSFDWYKSDVSRFGADKAIKFEKMAQKFGKPDLEILFKKYGYDIR